MTASYTVTEIGKVHDMLPDGQGGWRCAAYGSAGTTNLDPGVACACCGLPKHRQPKQPWLYWPLVGFACLTCSRHVHDDTPKRVLFIPDNGHGALGLVVPEVGRA